MVPKHLITPPLYAIPPRELTLDEREAMAEPRTLPSYQDAWDRIVQEEEAKAKAAAT